MADISYECPSCGAARQVSEFADPQKIRCATCDVPMRRAGEQAEAQPEPQPPAASKPEQGEPGQAASPPEPAPPPAAKPKSQRLKLARSPQNPAPAETSEKQPPAYPPAPSAPLELHPKTKRKKPMISNSFLVLLTFLFVGGASGFLRYGNLLPTEILGLIQTYSWAGILFLHVVITLRALTNDIVQGILCLLIPGWSLIYLAISDQFYLKALVFGLLIGLAEDGGIQIAGFISEILSAIQEFISSGGGDTRTLP